MSLSVFAFSMVPVFWVLSLFTALVMNSVLRLGSLYEEIPCQGNKLNVLPIAKNIHTRTLPTPCSNLYSVFITVVRAKAPTTYLITGSLLIPTS